MKNEFKVSVDPVVFSIIDEQLHVLLKKRTTTPFLNMFGFPGGLMEATDGNMEKAITRVLKNKTDAEVNYVEQLKTRSGHDPRGPTVSTAYIALVAKQEISDTAAWIPVEKALKMNLAFDHNEVLEVAVQRLTNKVNYSTLPMYFLPRPFTLPKLQKVYEILLNEPVNKSMFRDKIMETGIIKPIGQKIKEGPYRPADLYDFGDEKLHTFSKNLLR